MFMRGRGVDKSEEEAAQWFSKAAQLDHPGAEYQLGMMYIRGRGGIPKDEGVGLQWLEKSAAQGHEDAKKEVAKRRRP
jgi:TPR repeat protein